MPATRRSVFGAPPKVCYHYPRWSGWGEWRGVKRPDMTLADAIIESQRALELARDCKVPCGGPEHP